MNYHIIPNEKFTEKFLRMMSSEHFCDTNTVFVYDMPGVEPFTRALFPNVTYISHTAFSNIAFADLEEGNNKLFVHALSDQVLPFLYQNRKRSWMNRLVIILWGADIYNHYFILTSGDRRLHLGDREIERKKKKLLEHCRFYMTFAAPDYDFACKLYNCRGKQFDCLYPSNVDAEYLDAILGKARNAGSGKTRVLLGNSATKTNQHIEALNKLSKYKGYIQIICPLSYGDFYYRDAVITHGNALFGTDFIAVTDYFLPEEYATLLYSVDIAVFNNNRQQATANIEILAYLGKKIFIRSDTSMWGHYVVRDGCAFSDAIAIGQESFDAFRQIADESVRKNHDYIKKVWNIDYVASLWDAVLNEPV